VGFQEFLGNESTVHHLRESIRTERIPQALILAGPKGAGKYTLALMFAQAINCLVKPVADGLPDFCGECVNCTRIAASQALEERVNEAVEAREEMREVDKKETRILIQTYPDLLIIPPDPPQLLIKLGQVRTVIHGAYYRPPTDGQRAIYLFTSSAFMKEAANSLLKVLEEPPPKTTIILLAENPSELLPTIRSRALIYRLGAIPTETLEALLQEKRKDWKPAQRSLIARLSEGAVGRALGFDIETYLASRQDALTLLRNAVVSPDYSTLFKMTETYRGGAEGQEKTINLLRTMGTLLEDLLLIQAGTATLVRNIDIMAELTKMAGSVTLKWIENASSSLAQVESGMRRNLLRPLSLDALAVDLSRGAETISR
jgi:DNA polymerase III subunit delta'